MADLREGNASVLFSRSLSAISNPFHATLLTFTSPEVGVVWKNSLMDLSRARVHDLRGLDVIMSMVHKQEPVTFHEAMIFRVHMTSWN